MSLPNPPEVTPANSAAATELARAGLPADILEAVGSDTPLVPPKEPLGARLAGYFGQHQLLLLVLSTLMLWAILALPPLFPRGDLQIGQASPRDLVAPQNAYLPDRAETQKRRAAAAALVTPAYNPNPGAQSVALSNLRRLISQIRPILSAPAPTPTPEPTRRSRKAPGSKPESKFARLRDKIQEDARWRPSIPVVQALEKIPPARWNLVKNGAEEGVRSVYLKGRLRSDVADDAGRMWPFINRGLAAAQPRLGLSNTEANVARVLAAKVADVPNVMVNERATEAARREAQNAVLPVFQRIEANQPIVREGQNISEEQWAQLQELGLVEPRFKPILALAKLAICLLLVAAVAGYLAQFQKTVLNRPAALWLVAVVPVLLLAAFRLLLRVPHADFTLVPIAATAAMLITVLVGPRAGLPVGFVVAALGAMMARADAGLFLAAVLSAWFGTLLVAQIPTRLALIRTIILLSLANAILALALGLLRETGAEELVSTVAWSALAGVLSVAAMAGLAMFLERPFGITSHLRLLELMAPDETVLRRMQTEAPGTYTHSLMVSLLSESAAKVVGADPLLCRVGGLYHDIGKLRRPHCFVENQSGDNIHDRLAPGLSALLIKAHVKDGLELGRALRLPGPVLEIIQSHHGTSLIAYFVHKARQNAEKEGTPAPAEKNFRYEGPRPRSKEAAILLLADAVEASSRALVDVTPENLEKHIQTIFEGRLSEGELADCELTLREIGEIRASFFATLRGVMHQRISYPDPAQLKGELEGNADWVAQTLGGRVANGAQNRENKEDAAERAPESRREILQEQKSGVKKGRRARRRAENTANGAIPPSDPTSESSIIPDQNAGEPALEQSGAPVATGPSAPDESFGAHHAPTDSQSSGANGHAPHPSNGNAALSEPTKSLENR